MNASTSGTEFTAVGTEVIFGRMSPSDGATKVRDMIASVK